MENFKLAISFVFTTLTQLLQTITSHWLLGLFLLVAIFALIINLMLMVKGSK